MNNFDIQAYLEGGLKGDALIAFERELVKNPELAKEVEAQRKLIEDLKAIDLKNKVKIALAEGNQDSPVTKGSSFVRNMIFGLLAVLLGTYLIYSYSQQKTPTKKEIFTEEDQQQPTAVDTANSPIIEIEEKRKTVDQKLFAGNNPPKKKAKKSGPVLRSISDDSIPRSRSIDTIGLDSYLPASTTLGNMFDKIDSAIRRGDNAKAFARLQLLENVDQFNDTIAFLKSYCLLTMEEGEEAIRVLDGLENALPPWSDFIEWYRVKGYLLLNDQKEAIPLLTKISSKDKHTFKTNAAELLESLE